MRSGLDRGCTPSWLGLGHPIQIGRMKSDLSDLKSEPLDHDLVVKY
jgi:hypothetical protein